MPTLPIYNIILKVTNPLQGGVEYNNLLSSDLPP